MAREIADGVLAGRLIMVTGAASGIGRACAESLASEGAAVALIDVQEDDLRDVHHTIESQNGTVVSVLCDVADQKQVKHAVNEVRADHGPIDGLVAAAGISRSGAPHVLHETDEDEWRPVIDVNVMGLVNIAREVLPDMKRYGYGTVVAFGSTYSFLGASKLAPYAASKAAIVQVVRSIARDYGRHGVRANTICPGWIDTPLLRTDVELAGDFNEVMTPVRERTFLGRLGKASEIADTCVFLSADYSSYITGSFLVVDGGYSIA